MGGLSFMVLCGCRIICADCFGISFAQLFRLAQKKKREQQLIFNFSLHQGRQGGVGFCLCFRRLASLARSRKSVISRCERAEEPREVILHRNGRQQQEGRGSMVRHVQASGFRTRTSRRSYSSSSHVVELPCRPFGTVMSWPDLSARRPPTKSAQLHTRLPLSRSRRARNESRTASIWYMHTIMSSLFSCLCVVC